jgi:hypothetical protein
MATAAVAMGNRNFASRFTRVYLATITPWGVSLWKSSTNL